MAKKELEDPPLELKMRYGTGPDGLTKVVVTQRRRGFLIDVELRKVERKLHDLPIKPKGRLALASLCERLREHLDSVDLPTDRWPVAPRELDGGYDPEEHGIVADEDLWIGVVEDSTEPLTRDRIAAYLLHTLLKLLEKSSDGQLADIFMAMDLYRQYSMVGDLNALALAGDAAKKGLEAGPRAKKERAKNVRKIVLAKARECWSDHPKLEGQPFNTAKKIAPAVNDARQAIEPGCQRLSPKTIADHLRLAIHECVRSSEDPELANSEI